ncbi:unnamed protein product, partial [Rotaria magnacalcarata]
VIINADNAVDSVIFQYIDLWSSPWAWGGDTPPEADTIVSIQDGKTVYFDTITLILNAVIIDNSSLIFDDNQGIDTEAYSFQHNAVITMHGHLRSIELPICRTLRQPDTIAIGRIRKRILPFCNVSDHHKPVTQTWTYLDTTASSGSSKIVLRQSVNWPVGNTIVIATTDDYLSQGQSEIRKITAISNDGRTLALDFPLAYTHLGVTQHVGSTVGEVRAEVGLLSHNIIFQGAVLETWNSLIVAYPTGFNPGEFAVQACFLGRYGEEIGSDQFGAIIMASASMDSSNGIQRAILRLSNMEIYNVDQAFHLGRYPVRFHMNGNMNSSYIKSSSIHIENNIIYNIIGGAIFLEDGAEIGDVLDGNLAIYVRTNSSLLNEDVTPAAFWVNNAYNVVINNAVAGGTHFGYWYRMLQTPDGPSFATYPNYCPYRPPFGRFFNNTLVDVHGVGRFGVWIFPEYSPAMVGSCWNDASYQAIQIRNAIIFDNDDAGLRCVTAIDHQETNLPNLRSPCRANRSKTVG